MSVGTDSRRTCCAGVRGCDIESKDPQSGALRLIEAKGRAAGARKVIVTRNEILTALGIPDKWWLAVGEVEDGRAGKPTYVARPFGIGPDHGATTVNHRIADLLERGEVA